MDDLLAHVRHDKEWNGEGSAMLNRYPIRFVLFESFGDLYDFADRLQGVHFQSIEGFMDAGEDDMLLTHSELGQMLVDYVKKLPTNDFIIAPFSELARFYENSERYADFDNLVRTIRLAEPPLESQQRHQRLYIPIIGMQGKMGKFENDPNIQIWEYKSQTPIANYHLILSKGTTYGVQGLDDKYSVAKSLKQWLGLWRTQRDVHQNIICSSRAIFSNARNARPDNAFTYTICRNCYEFLTKGLKLDFGNVTDRPEDAQHWETLATEIDINDFDFDQFVKQRIGVFSLADSVDLIKAWLECDSAFDKWLLSLYYQKHNDGNDYLSCALAACEELTNPVLFSTLATLIFEMPQSDLLINDRRAMLTIGAKYNIRITEMAEQKVKARLKAIAADPARGYYEAEKLLTPITESEKCLMIEWVGKGELAVNSVKNLFPDLYAYLGKMPVSFKDAWVEKYFADYRESKISNRITDCVSATIAEHNDSSVKFHGWRDEFKTVKTILNNRTDIEVIYWIDGLGVDWLPFIASILQQSEHDGIYLNEIHLAVAELPTRTSNNKAILQSLVPDGKLEKIGDLDSFAHKQKSYPSYIIEELKIVANAIKEVISKYNGKKIAFVSDHGISYLSQHAQGLGLAGVTADHSGRVAERANSSVATDDKYIILDDGKTLCSLTHASLTSKVPTGLGAHGGATPEEVLVPIIVVSNKKNGGHFTVKLLNDEITVSNPVLEFTIKGLSSIDVPMLSYNGVEYSLNHIGGDKYQSEKLNVVETCRQAIVTIGNEFQQKETIKINTGAEEEDLFGDLL